MINQKENSVNLNVLLEDDDWINISKKFLEDIEKNFTKYEEEYNKKQEVWNEIKKTQEFKNNNHIYIPEKLSKKSPLTIINAPWGTGKTHFIENFLELLILNKIKSEIFKKTMIIDAWKFSNSKDVPVEFMQELTKTLIKMKYKNQLTDKIKKVLNSELLKKLIPNRMSLSLGCKGIAHVGTEWEIKDLNKDEKIKLQKELKKITENLDPTIIFIDNLERLGSYSWDLLKSIIKLQEFSNFLIILPLNINKLINNKEVDKSEYPIDKYIDFNSYNFKQDYSHYFKNKSLDDKFCQEITKILNIEIEGEKLSIRELDKKFIACNVGNLKEKYEIYNVVYKNIWNEKTHIEKSLRKDILAFYNNQLEKQKKYQSFYNSLINSHGKNILFSILDQKEFKEYSFGFWETPDKYLYGWGEEPLTEMNKMVKLFNKEISKNKKKLKTNKQKLNEIEKDIEELKKYNEEWKKEKELKELELQDAQSKDGEHYNNDKVGELQMCISNFDKKIMEQNQKIESGDTKVSEIYLNEKSLIQKKEMLYIHFKKLEKIMKELLEIDKPIFLNDFEISAIYYYTIKKNDEEDGDLFNNDRERFKKYILSNTIELLSEI